MGYLSASRSIEAIHFLRLHSCPYEHPDCHSHCLESETNGGAQRGDRHSEFQNQLPCQTIEPLRDSTLWEAILQPGQRSGLWRSQSRILQWYPPEDQVCFCYVHVGTEVARVEFPFWVAQDRQILDQSLSILLGQVDKGFGYPVAIAEAHNQAVVRGGDRARFFALLEQQMVKAGLRNVGVSYKETRKRGSIA